MHGRPAGGQLPGGCEDSPWLHAAGDRDMSAFSEDLKRWMAREREPHDGTLSNLRLRPRDVVALFWRHAPVWATCIYRISNACTRHHVRILPTILERLNL